MNTHGQALTITQRFLGIHHKGQRAKSDFIQETVLIRTREIETYGRHGERRKTYYNTYAGYYDGENWLTVWCFGCKYIWETNEEYPNEHIEVTHWMPLPEPPKEE